MVTAGHVLSVLLSTTPSYLACAALSWCCPACRAWLEESAEKLRQRGEQVPPLRVLAPDLPHDKYSVHHTKAFYCFCPK